MYRNFKGQKKIFNLVNMAKAFEGAQQKTSRRLLFAALFSPGRSSFHWQFSLDTPGRPAPQCEKQRRRSKCSGVKGELTDFMSQLKLEPVEHSITLLASKSA